MSRYDDLINRGAALTHPEIVKAIHADYIALGTDMIASNSFAAGRNVLEDAGAEAIKVATKYANVDAFCLMHSDVRLTERGTAEIRECWDGPIGAYAHSARYRDGKLDFEDNVTPEQYGSYVPVWTEAGACMVGGCYGIGPSYIEKVVDQMQRGV